MKIKVRDNIMLEFVDNNSEITHFNKNDVKLYFIRNWAHLKTIYINNKKYKLEVLPTNKINTNIKQTYLLFENFEKVYKCLLHILDDYISIEFYTYMSISQRTARYNMKWFLKPTKD